MAPRGTARLCDTCDKLVHNLSAMNEADARALLRRRPDDGLCIRYLYDSEGAIWFGDGAAQPLVPARRLARRAAVVAAAAATLLVVPALTEACGGAGPNPNPYNYAPESDAASTAPSTEPDGRVPAQVTVNADEGGAAAVDIPSAVADGGAEAGAETDAVAPLGDVSDGAPE
jgi:hypothetical protein